MRKQRRRWLRNGFGGLFVAGWLAASSAGLAQAERDGLSEFFHSEAVDSIEVLVEDARSRGKVDGARLIFQWTDAWGKKGNRQVVTAKDGRGLLDLAGQKSARDCLPRGMFGLFGRRNEVDLWSIRR